MMAAVRLDVESVLAAAAPPAQAAAAARRLARSRLEQSPQTLTPTGPKDAPLTAFHSIEDGVSVGGGLAIGISENLETEEREMLYRVEDVAFDQAVLQIDPRHESELRRMWDLTNPGRSVPGKVWRLFVDAYERDARKHKARRLCAVHLAWLEAWRGDAYKLLAQVRYCGMATLEIVTDAGCTYRRDRCRTTRCPHCGPRIVGHEWRERLRAQLHTDQDRGEDHLFWTLTLSPKKWCEEHGLPFDESSAILAQRWVGQAFADLVEDVRVLYPDVEYFRAIELHESVWPHVHVLVRGGLQRAAHDEAISTPNERRHGDTWADVARYAQEQRDRQKLGELRVARCPFPKLRKQLKAMASKRGFGTVMDVSPVDPASIDRITDYLSKGPQAFGQAKRIKDVVELEHASIADELGKGSQRAKRPLARGVRAFEASRRRKGGFPGFLWNAPRPKSAPPPDGNMLAEIVQSVRRINLPIEQAKACLGRSAGGDVIVADFTGPVPDAGEARPRQLEAFVAQRSLLLSLRAAFKFEAEEAAVRALERGYVPIDMGGPVVDITRTARGSPGG